MDNEEEDLDELAEMPVARDDDAVEDASSEDTERYFSEYSRPAASERRSPRHIWLISYSDFMTILMIFFLAMYGYTYLAKASLLNARQRVSHDAAFTAMIDRLKQNLGASVSVAQEGGKTTVSLV